jgi:hypothetical protein
MTLFGQPIDGGQIMSLVSLLLVLVLLVGSLRGHSAYARWFRQWDGRSKDPAEHKPAPRKPPVDPTSRKGPWG